jgi:hypothetical protein
VLNKERKKWIFIYMQKNMGWKVNIEGRKKEGDRYEWRERMNTRGERVWVCDGYLRIERGEGEMQRESNREKGIERNKYRYKYPFNINIRSRYRYQY